MSDNTILPGTGETYAAKDRAGIKFQEVIVDNLPTTAFGELKVAENTPQVQIKFPYGITHPDVADVLANNVSSAVTVADGQATVTSAGVANAFCQIRTKDVLRYGPGQGAVMKGTCIFTTGAANSSQVFGAGDDDEGLFFGYDGAAFGVLRRAGGSLEMQTLEITGAATGSGDITITLDGSPVVVAIVNGDTIAEVTEKIVNEAAAFLNAGRGWEALSKDNVYVDFLSLVAESAGGVFSFVDTGGTGVTAAAMFASIVGAAPNEEWVTQAAWNVDKMLGNGPSGMTLDPTKGNVFKIEFQYLGYGPIFYSVENSETGVFQLVHIIQYSNKNTVPTLVNPTLNLSLIAKTETGYTGGTLVMKTASMAGFIQGKETTRGIRRSVSATKSIGTTETVLLVLSNSNEFNSLKNKVSVYPDFTSFSSESTKPSELILYKNVTSIEGAASLTDIQTDVSVMKYGSAGTGVTGGQRLLTFELGGETGGQRDLSNFNEPILPGERWVLTARVASGAAANITASFTWLERI